jgi:hypothetical protein
VNWEKEAAKGLGFSEGTGAGPPRPPVAAIHDRVPLVIPHEGSPFVFCEPTARA